MTEWTQAAGAFLLGRKTYEIFAGSWPNATGPADEAAALNSRPKYVASRTLANVDWSNSHLLGGDIADAVTSLRHRMVGRSRSTAAVNSRRSSTISSTGSGSGSSRSP